MDVEVAASGFTKEMAEDFDEIIVLEDDQKAESEEESESGEEGDNNQDEVGPESEEPSDKFEETNPADVIELQEQFSNAMAELRLDKSNLPSNSKGEENDDKESVGGFSYISRSTAATIAPEVIKQRLKKSFEKGDKANAKKRIRAKGEASATTRQRRDNFDNIRQSSGIWGWE